MGRIRSYKKIFPDTKILQDMPAIPENVLARFNEVLKQRNYDIRTVQTMPAHTDVRTTMMYTHRIPGKTAKEVKAHWIFKHHFIVKYNKFGMFFAFIVNNTIECISWTIPSS